jgi:hypothetical protein
MLKLGLTVPIRELVIPDPYAVKAVLKHPLLSGKILYLELGSGIMTKFKN